MKCPVCKNVTLLMSEKSGIEIDYCPECRGIWLDRGELDKIMEKNNNIFSDDQEIKINQRKKNHLLVKFLKYLVNSNQIRLLFLCYKMLFYRYSRI